MSSEALDTIVQVACSRDESKAEYIQALYSSCKEHIYSCDEPVQHLGFRPEAYSAYYSTGMSKADIELVQRYMEQKQLPGWNTRVKKVGNESKFEIWQAAANRQEALAFEDFEGAKIRVVAGDYAPILARAIEYLKKAKAYGI